MRLYRNKKVNKILFITPILCCINGAYIRTNASDTIDKNELLLIVQAKIDRESNYISDRIGDTITVSGRVSVTPRVLWNDIFQMTIQDRTAGITNQYRGLTQINPEIEFIDTIRGRIVKPRLTDENNLEAIERI